MSRAAARRRADWLPVALVLGAAVLAWEAGVRAFHIPNWLLPAPSAVLIALATTPDLLAGHTLVTLAEVALGFVLALVTGVALALLIAWSPALERSLYPFLIVSQTIPMSAIAPILLIWLGYGIEPKVLVVALACFFPIVVSMADGLRAADPELVNLMRTLGASRATIFRTVRIPGSLPHLFSGVKIAITISLYGAVIAELTGGSAGLGYLIRRSISQFLTERVFAAVVILGALGILFFALATLAERWLLPWHTALRARRVP